MLREGKSLFLVGLLVLAILALCPVPASATPDPVSTYYESTTLVVNGTALNSTDSLDANDEVYYAVDCETVTGYPAEEYDYVDNNTSDVDSSADKGTHSNFTAQQYGPDSVYDTLTEANTGGGTSDVFTDGFEDQTFNKWDDNGVTNWQISTAFAHDSTYSAESTSDYLGDLISDNIDLSGASSAVFECWTYATSVDANEFLLYFYNGTAYNLIKDLDVGDDVWNYHSETIDSQYFVSNFRIKFHTTGLGKPQDVYVDDVNVNKTLLDNYELDLEIQWTDANYTWVNEELYIKTGTTDAEDIKVYAWNVTGSSWHLLFNDLTANSWNNISVTDYLTSQTFTIRFKGGTESGDINQDTWQIDCTLLHTWDIISEVDVRHTSQPVTESLADVTQIFFEDNFKFNATVTAYLEWFNWTANDWANINSGSVGTNEVTWSKTWTSGFSDVVNSSGYMKVRIYTSDESSAHRLLEDYLHWDVTYTDTTPPAWSNAGTNNTLAGQPTLFHVKWTDNYGLSGFIFGTNNTGTWANDTWTSMSGTTDWSNVTKILNSTGGLVVQWRVWANDTSNNWNDTGILTLTTVQPTVALHPSTVSWTLGSEPASKPYFNLTVDVTDITNSTAVTFSIHWDPTILSLTAVTKGDCLENGDITRLMYVVNYTAGNLSDCVYAQITPIVPKTFPPTTWGLVATLTFKFIGTSPTADSPIDTDIIFVNEPPKRPTYWAAWPGPVSHNFTQMLPSHFHYEAPPVVGYNLNLRVMDWDLTDSIPSAYVYKNSDVKISDANGWANWTGVNGTVQIKVKWYGFWVNGTSITVDSNKTIDLQCNIFDIEVTCIEELQNATLQNVNVTVYNASVAGNMIRTGTTGPDGKVNLANVPNATLTFICYDGASPKHVIANVTRTITAENQTETITCTEHYITTTHTWGIIGIYSSALCLGLILLLVFAVGKPSRMLSCLKERIKKVRSKQNKRRKGGKKTHESFNA